MVAQGRAPLPPSPAPFPIESPATFEPESTVDVPRADAAPPPPARVGPLATPEMVAADLGVAPIQAAAPAEVAPSASAPGTESVPPPPAPLPLEKYTLERCARIAASIGRTRDKQGPILAEHDLSEEVWEQLRAHWAAEVKKETERGKTALLRAYDTAYVAQLEDERGSIAVEEYARIVVASERGTAAQTLADLGLPEASMLRIQRVWMGRMQRDPELRRLVRAAVESASES